MADPMRAQLHAGDTLRIRYAGTKPSSTQGRAWRTVRIIVGPHEDYDYTHGPVVTVKDLTDPDSVLVTYMCTIMVGAVPTVHSATSVHYCTTGTH